MASWKHVGGWAARGFLALLILFEVEYWLDILVFDVREYERLIGSESACGVARAYCSWPDFILYDVPFVAFAVAAFVTLAWRSLPRREGILAALTIVTCTYLIGRASKIGLAAACHEAGLFL